MKTQSKGDTKERYNENKKGRKVEMTKRCTKEESRKRSGKKLKSCECFQRFGVHGGR